MSQGITTPASDGLCSLLSYWRKGKAQLDREIPTYMSVHGDVQPVIGKYKCVELWRHLNNTAGMLCWLRSRHCHLQKVKIQVNFWDMGEASSTEMEKPISVSVEHHQLPLLLSRLVPHVRHPPPRYLVPSVQKDKQGDCTQPLLSHRVGMGSHLQSRHSQEAQWHQSPSKQVKTRNLGPRV